MTNLDDGDTTKTPLVDAENADGKSDTELFALILRQQELIVRQNEQLLRAMETTIGGHIRPPLSLRAEVDELLSALAHITADDIARFGDFARSLFDTIKSSSVVGGGADRSPS